MIIAETSRSIRTPPFGLTEIAAIAGIVAKPKICAKIARIAPSLGGVESLIEQPLVMSYYEHSPEDRRRFGIADNMIRLSCGIENAEDLIEDLRQALEAK